MKNTEWQYLISGNNSKDGVLLLHGTGGDEQSLLPLAKQVAPHLPVVSIRGRSLEEGLPRFFRRFSATSYDQEQIRSESNAIADFLDQIREKGELTCERFWVIGYSNGANIGLTTLFLRPESLAGGVFIRPVQALEELPTVNLETKRIMLLKGVHDPYLTGGESLAAYCREAGAEVEEHILPAGHEITAGDLKNASLFFQQIPPA